MKATLEVINRMQAEGVIAHYAIGGGVGATFYLEPAATLDIDIFVILPYEQEGSLVSLSRIYEFLQARGYRAQDEHIVIEGWPVQFLVPATELEKQAVVNAVPERFEDINIWVMPEEFLVLIALQRADAKIICAFYSSWIKGPWTSGYLRSLSTYMDWRRSGRPSRTNIRRAAMSKKEMRKRLARLPFAEKVRILEKLRDRSLAIAKVRSQRNSDEPDSAAALSNIEKRNQE